MDLSPENLSDRPTPSTSTSHCGSSSHTSYTSPDDPHASQYRKYNSQATHVSHNNTNIHGSIAAINANANFVTSESIVASPSQFFADTAALNQLAADLYQPSMSGGGMAAAAGTSAPGNGLGIPAGWDMNGAAATTGMSIGPEAGWQFDNLEWLAEAGV